MPSYTKDYNYTDVDTAVLEYPTQVRSTRSRIRVHAPRCRPLFAHLLPESAGPGGHLERLYRGQP